MRQRQKKDIKFASRIKSRATARLSRPLPREVVPSFFTLMNALCGFLAILQIYQGQLAPAAYLVMLAGFFDAIDGYMARLAKASSEFGIELDSLSDVVSFGVAPGFLMYAAGLKDQGTVGMLIAALPTICGAVRLARFNVMAHESGHSDHFKGLPIPANAGVLISFFLISQNHQDFFAGYTYGINGFIVPLVIGLAILMVSTVPYDKIPSFSREFVRAHKFRVFLFIGYFLTVILFQATGILVVFTVFTLKGLIMWLVNMYRMMFSDDDEVVTEE
jgi:CDP-diacylglycerol--serine O-phosphatidyltransferase